MTGIVAEPEPVVVVTAGRVVTMAGPDRDAFAIRGGHILDVDTVDALRERFPMAERVDFGDATVLPAFNDAHQHPGMVAEDLLHLDVSPERVTSHGDLMATLAERVADTPPGQWIRATRYDHTRTTGGRIIDRADLDAISTQHPILVVHVGAHWGVTNTLGLAEGGYTDDQQADRSTGIRGTEIRGTDANDGPARDAAGRFTGLLNEQVLFDYCYPAMATGGRTVIPPSDLMDRLRALARFATQLHAAGIGSVTDALCGPAELRLYSEARRRDELSLRIGALLAHPHLSTLTELGVSTGFGDEWLRIVGIKAFADDAIAGRTCLVEEPFEGSSEHGMQTTSDEELRALAIRCQTNGDRLAIHANGDRAIAKVLAALSAARAAVPRRGPRHRIEHCSIVTPEILSTMRRLGVIAVPFGSYVAYHGEKLLSWYGARRLNRMFAHRSLLDAGIAVAGSSDYPCGPYEPLLAVQSCVTRQSVTGEVLGADQRISVREALALYTTGSAFAAGEAKTKGRIAPGYLADFTVLAEDPLRVDPSRIASIDVHSTWIDGRCVWPPERQYLAQLATEGSTVS